MGVDRSALPSCQRWLTIIFASWLLLFGMQSQQAEAQDIWPAAPLRYAVTGIIFTCSASSIAGYTLHYGNGVVVTMRGSSPPQDITSEELELKLDRFETYLNYRKNGENNVLRRLGGGGYGQDIEGQMKILKDRNIIQILSPSILDAHLITEAYPQTVDQIQYQIPEFCGSIGVDFAEVESKLKALPLNTPGYGHDFSYSFEAPLELPGTIDGPVAATIRMDGRIDFYLLPGPQPAPPPVPDYEICETELLADQDSYVNTAPVDNGIIQFRALHMGISGIDDLPVPFPTLPFQCFAVVQLQRFSQLSPLPVQECSRGVVLNSGLWSGWYTFLDRNGQPCRTKGENQLKVSFNPSDLCSGPFRYQLRYPAKDNETGHCFNLKRKVTCKAGEVLRDGRCVKQPCPPGTVRRNNLCVSIVAPCPAGTVRRAGRCVPIVQPCPHSMVRRNGQCVTLEQHCPPGTVRRAGKCVPVVQPCPHGMVRRNGQCVEQEMHCPPGTIRRGAKCVPVVKPCPHGMVRRQGKCVKIDHAITCPPGTRLLKGKCVAIIKPCPKGMVRRKGKCVKVLGHSQPAELGSRPLLQTAHGGLPARPLESALANLQRAPLEAQLGPRAVDAPKELFR